MGEGVAMRVRVENTTAEGQPMTLARVGIPGGMVFQTWQLKELRDKGLIDFYETRPREVILYWRQLAPSAKHELELALLATVPGTYEAPASSAYLYYTAEDKGWSPPVRFSVDR
jgi:alpha-2-macroglobulin-like protein